MKVTSSNAECQKLLDRPTRDLAETEGETIARVAAQVGCSASFLAAIRIAENGGAGREFGVLSQSAPSYESQARVAALSIVNNTYRYVTTNSGKWPTDSKGGFLQDFIKFMQRRWAPVGAVNDPNGLNNNWYENVCKAYSTMKVEG